MPDACAHVHMFGSCWNNDFEEYSSDSVNLFRCSSSGKKSTFFRHWHYKCNQAKSNTKSPVWSFVAISTEACWCRILRQYRSHLAVTIFCTSFDLIFIESHNRHVVLSGVRRIHMRWRFCLLVEFEPFDWCRAISASTRSVVAFLYSMSFGILSKQYSQKGQTACKHVRSGE